MSPTINQRQIPTWNTDHKSRKSRNTSTLDHLVKVVEHEKSARRRGGDVSSILWLVTPEVEAEFTDKLSGASIC